MRRIVRRTVTTVTTITTTITWQETAADQPSTELEATSQQPLEQTYEHQAEPNQTDSSGHTVS